MSIFRFSNAGGFGTYQRYNDFLAGNPTTPVINDFGSMYPLGVVTLSSAQATISFENIPQTYKHLQIRSIGRGSASSGELYSRVRFNNVTASSNYYALHQLYGQGTSVVSGVDSNSDYMQGGYYPISTAPASTFGTEIWDLLDYTNTNKNKTVRSLSGFDVNGSGGFILFRSSLFLSTAAVTRIDITASGGQNWVANSSFALYGII